MNRIENKTHRFIKSDVFKAMLRSTNKNSNQILLKHMFVK